MANYIEEFEIGNRTFGIEDFQAPGEHYFPPKQPLRFKCWVGGGSIGSEVTIEHARERIFGYARERLDADLVETKARLRALEKVDTKLGNDVFNLCKFAAKKRRTKKRKK